MTIINLTLYFYFFQGACFEVERVTISSLHQHGERSKGAKEIKQVHLAVASMDRVLKVR